MELNRSFGIGFGLDNFDAHRFANFIIKYKQSQTQQNDDQQIQMQAVVITANEEKYLKILEDRKERIHSLIARSNSNAVAYAQIINEKFTNLIQTIQTQKEKIIQQITQEQHKKQHTIKQNVVSLQAYLQNIDNINKEYNQWLIQGKMTRNERKEKLSSIVETECDKILPLVSDVQVIFDNKMIVPFLNNLCTIINVGLFYPDIVNLKAVNIGTSHVNIGWNASLSKEFSSYIQTDDETSDLSMDHILMSLSLQGSRRQTLEDEKEPENENKHLVHCLDFELDEDKYTYKFVDLQPNTSYRVTLKCMSILEHSLISEHHRSDLKQCKVHSLEFQTLDGTNDLIFSSALARLNIANEGKTVVYQNGFDAKLALALLGDYIDLSEECEADRVMKLEFNIDAKNDHVGFGFVDKGFDRFEVGPNDWGFGSGGGNRAFGVNDNRARKCILYYSDRDFKTCPEFADMNGKRLQFEEGATVHMVIDCKAAVARIWVGENEGGCVQCGLTKEFAIAVSMGGCAGTAVSLIKQEFEASSSL